MNEREGFLAALEANEDDTTARLVYADWLDERGEHEEADRQREWPAAKAWLVRFCAANNTESYESPISYTELIELAREAVKRSETEDGENWLWFHCGNNETMCDALRQNPHEFWLNWSVVTGVPTWQVPEEKRGFSCAC